MRYEDLTIATTTHNNAGMCLEMLRSFETSIGPVAEIIVVDDHSAVPIALPEFSSPAF